MAEVQAPSSQFSALQKTSDGKFHLAKKTFDGTVDPYALITELSEAKAANIQVYRDEIEINTDKKIPAIEELRLKTKTLQTSLEKLTNDLRVNYGSTQTYPNALNAKVATLKKDDGAVSIRADVIAQATENDHTFSITQVAKKDYIKSGFIASKISDEVSFSGNLSINNTIIHIDATDTLSKISDKINAASETTNVIANIIQTGDDGNYMITLEATEFAKPINFQGTTGSSSTLFGLVPSKNTTAESLADVGAGPLNDTINSEFACSDHTATLHLNGSLQINGETFTITSGVSTIDSIISDINANVLAGVTASLQTIVSNGITSYGLTLTATSAGVPIDFTGTATTLLGLIPNSENTISDQNYDNISSGFTTLDPDAAMGYAGSLVLNNQTITLTTNTTLNQLISSINDNKDANVTASLALVDGTTDTYYLKITANTKGDPISMNGTAGTDSSLTSPLGLKLPATNTNIDNLIAKFSFDGIEMTRSSNTVKNLISGVTFTLNAESESNTIFSIENLKTEGFTAISDMVTAYNELVKALAVHKKEKSDGTPDASATLYGDRLLSQIEYLLQNIRSGPSLGNTLSDESYQGLSAIGIDFTTAKDPGEDNIPGMMLLNKEKLIDCISNKPYVNIIQLFGNYAQSSNPHFSVFELSSSVSDKIIGKDVAVSYQYIGPQSTDEKYNANFTMPQPTTALGEVVAGKEITIEYFQNSDNTFSASFYGIQNQPSVRVDNIIDGQIILPENSIFKGLKLTFNGTAPDAGGNSLKATVTLPDYVATLSCSGVDTVTVKGVQFNKIEGPKGSAFEGLIFGYQSGATSPLVMDGASFTTTLMLTQGVAVKFAEELNNATKRHMPGVDPTGLFDLSVEELLSQNKTNQKNIEIESEAVERQKRAYEPLIQRLYALNDSYLHITAVLEKINSHNKK